MPETQIPVTQIPVTQILVEIVYARADEQVLEQLKVSADATVESVIRQSGFLERFPEIDLATNKVGVFGKAAALSAGLTEGDRVEIYRPLIADPKEARRKRAAQGKAMKKGVRETSDKAEKAPPSEATADQNQS